MTTINIEASVDSPIAEETVSSPQSPQIEGDDDYMAEMFNRDSIGNYLNPTDRKDAARTDEEKALKREIIAQKKEENAKTKQVTTEGNIGVPETLSENQRIAELEAQVAALQAKDRCQEKNKGGGCECTLM